LDVANPYTLVEPTVAAPPVTVAVVETSVTIFYPPVTLYKAKLVELLFFVALPPVTFVTTL
jgi:hypothetical protein